jgi:2-phosphosulfolactate phosphatase
MKQVNIEWGPHGARKLTKSCDVTIVVDVLSFSTSVDIATGRAIRVLPYNGPLDQAQVFADQHGAELGRRRGQGGFSLSPASMLIGPAPDKLVLPSPNGSNLTLLAAENNSLVLCGCLRNAQAIAEVVAGFDSVGIIPAGEKWPDGSLRPALEDWLGAGAIISNLSGSWSPEARAAAAAFEAHRADLLEALRTCPSGIELIEWGYGDDVEIAAQYNASRTVPRFTPPVYQG